MAAVGDEIVLARMPGYLVGTSTVSSDSAGFTAETQIASGSFDLISGVQYRIDCVVPLNGNAADEATALLREDTSSGTVIAALSGKPVTTLGLSLNLLAFYTAVSTGSKTFVVTGRREAGSGGNVKLEAGSTRPLIIAVTVA